MSVVWRLFSRRWRFATLLVILGAALCVRLGIWQLDRLEQRRAFNSRVTAQLGQPPLKLEGQALQADLYNMEYRQVEARGQYDFSQEITILNQVNGSEWGVHLVTPLVLEGSPQAVLVDRGWIPAADYQSGAWSKYAEPGQVTVRGVLRRPRQAAEVSGRADPTPSPGQALRAWNFVNIPAIARQTSHPLLGAYIQQAPDPSWSGLPARSQPEIEITEGPHMGYALQWFTFAAILGLGYPFFVRRQERQAPAAAGASTPDKSPS
ncbi:MAG: SURF1 family protein [Chloroflexota bacterium]